MTHKKEAADSESSVHDEVVQLRADIDSLVATVRRLANGAAGSLVDGAKRTISHTGEEASEAYDAALAKGRRAMKTAGKTIKANPFLSIGIAVGVGLLLGRLLCHHSRG
jgi:ElaB/YqjD/DUF883 family membrane-anchored ribosome-binding protein